MCPVSLGGWLDPSRRRPGRPTGSPISGDGVQHSTAGVPDEGAGVGGGAVPVCHKLPAQRQACRRQGQHFAAPSGAALLIACSSTHRQPWKCVVKRAWGGSPYGMCGSQRGAGTLADPLRLFSGGDGGNASPPAPLPPPPAIAIGAAAHPSLRCT